MAVSEALGGIAAAAGSVIGQASSNAASKAAAREAGKQAIKLWQMQADYNTPANQVARLRAAGLNPNLIYGGGDANTGNMSHAPAMTEPARKSWDFSQVINSLTAVAQLRNINQQNKNLKAQTDSINADTALKDKTTQLREKELDLKSRELDILERTGMRPGIGSAIVGFGDAMARGLTGNSNSPLERASNVGKSIREAVNAGFPSFVDNSFDRGTRMAVEAADKKGLSGQSRANYIKKFVEIYKRSH